MNKKGFTLVELLAVMTLLLVIIFFGFRNFIKSFEKNRMKTFLSEALIISEGARNKYADDRLNEVNIQDAYFGSSETSTCYVFESALKDKYVSKYSYKYSGSVEVCHDIDCDYDTKIWLTNGEFYLNGVITDHTLKNTVIDYKFNDNNYLTCGVSSNTLNPAYAIDYSGKEETITIIRDGVYALEAWGAQGGHRGTYRGGYGGYAYNEIELSVGDKLYVNVGELGTDTKSGYNGGGPVGSNRSGGGGATTIAGKSGLISSPIVPDYVYNVAGGGGGATSYCCCCGGYETGYSGGGAVSERNIIGQSGYSYGKATGYGGGGGYRAQSGDNGDGRGLGGSGYIGNPLTYNGVMYGFNVPENTGATTKTYSTTNVSSEPISRYAKQGNGYAKITYLSEFSIKYDLNGGTVQTPNPTYYSHTSSAITLNNPTKYAYIFDGWFGSNGPVPQTNLTIPSGSVGNKFYTAHYVPVEYSITYNLNGGSFGENATHPSTYNIESSNITLSEPKKDGYVFIGWTGSNGEDPQRTVTISNGSSGNKTYTAVFEKVYTVTLDYNIDNYTFASDGSYMDSGLILDFDNNYNINMDVNIPTSGKRYLLIGNYNTSRQLNLEITTGNNVRIYQSGDRGNTGAITIGEDANFVFDYTAASKAYNATFTSASTNASNSGSLSQTGFSTATLRLGQDMRGGATFTGYNLKGLKITSGLTMSKLPTNVSLPGSNFVGWFTSKTGGTQVTSSTIPASESVTYYARWN